MKFILIEIRKIYKYLSTYVLMVLKVEFEEELERKFRELAMKKYGYCRGSIKKAVEEAFRNWIKLEERKI